MKRKILAALFLAAIILFPRWTFADPIAQTVGIAGRDATDLTLWRHLAGGRFNISGETALESIAIQFVCQVLTDGTVGPCGNTANFQTAAGVRTSPSATLANFNTLNWSVAPGGSYTVPVHYGLLGVNDGTLTGTFNLARFPTAEGLTNGLFGIAPMTFNTGTVSWNRAREPNADAIGGAGNGMFSVAPYIANATSFDRIRESLTDAQTNIGVIANGPMLFNGTNYDRARSAPGTLGVYSVNTEGTKATYSVGTGPFTPAAAATDIFGITGSATKTIRVLRIQITGIATAASAVDVFLVKRSTADGAFSATFTGVNHDSNNAAATAVVGNFTANPVLGTTVGNIRTQKITLSTASAAIPIEPVVFDFTTRNGQGMVLRGVAQGLFANWNAQTIAGNSVEIDVEWTEE